MPIEGHPVQPAEFYFYIDSLATVLVQSKKIISVIEPENHW